MRIFRNPFSPWRKPTAFTLVELIISIGMVLILMAGVVKVFKYATDAVGAGLAVSDIVRVQRSLGTLISTSSQGDFQYLNSDSTKCPAILLDSQQNDPSVSSPPTANSIVTTNNGDLGVVGGPIYLDKNDQANAANLTFSQVQFRQDSFSFFSRGAFSHQTGNGNVPGTAGGTFVSPITSSWAWIWYGHLWLPTNKPLAATDPNLYLVADNKTPSYPGAGDAAGNPNNFYARQWQLGRMAMLILPKNTTGPIGSAITDVFSGYWPGGNIKRYQSFLQEQVTPPKILTYTLQPLAFGSLSRDYNDGASTTITPAKDPGRWTVQQSRYDLAAVTSSSGDPFVDYFVPRLNSAAVPPAISPQTYVPSWWFPITPANSSALTNLSLNYRFQANPYPVRNATNGTLPALTSDQAAQTVPPIATGCVRFYVEYAGDFLDQNPTPGATYGQVTSDFTQGGFVPDGTDFYLDSNNVRHIRWYGLPRDTSGDGLANTVTGVNSQHVQDVLPLGDFLFGGSSAAPKNAPFEQFPLSGSWPAPLSQNHYICAWDSTPSGSAGYCKRPTMFRITVELIDTGGRLNSPRVLQYIVPVVTQQ